MIAAEHTHAMYHLLRTRQVYSNMTDYSSTIEPVNVVYGLPTQGKWQHAAPVALSGKPSVLEAVHSQVTLLSFELPWILIAPATALAPGKMTQRAVPVVLHCGPLVLEVAVVAVEQEFTNRD